MAEALIVSTTEYASKFAALLARIDYTGVIQAHSGTEARRLLGESEYDLVIINAPLVDESGNDLAVFVTENTTASVLLLVKEDISEAVEERVQDYGVVVMTKPLSQEDMYRTIKVLSANRRRLDKLMTNNRLLLNKIEELKLVDRAKCLLIMHSRMTEQEAHKYIEKKAMDMRMSKQEVAQKIISLKQHD